jgi:hypothetical protein
MADEPFDPYQQWLGIDASERPIDHYRLLGVARFEADAGRIAAAAEERMRYIRTFQTGPRGLHTQQLLNEMAAAKLRLLNPATKSEYDDRLRRTDAAAAEFAQHDDIALPEPIPAGGSAPLSGNGAATHPIPQPAADAIPVAGPANTPPLIRVGGRTQRPRAPTAWYRSLLSVAPILGAIAGVAWGVWYVGIRELPDERGAQAPAPPGGPTTDGPADEQGIVQQAASGEVNLTAELAEIDGQSPALVDDGDSQVISDWDSAGDSLRWMFRLRKPGVYRVRVTYAVSLDPPEGRLQVVSGKDDRSWDLRSSGDLKTFISDEQAVLALTQPGLHTLTLRMVETPRGQVLAIRDVVLVPQKRPGDKAGE